MQAIIYEHEQDLEELLGYLLSRSGFAHHFAESLEEFRRKITETNPELILLGTCPPHHNQLENALKIRSEFPDSQLLVLTTSRRIVKEIGSHEDSGFSCLEVPFPPKMLTQKLKEINGSFGTLETQ